jgi:hypothetical protein
MPVVAFVARAFLDPNRPDDELLGVRIGLRTEHLQLLTRSDLDEA